MGTSLYIKLYYPSSKNNAKVILSPTLPGTVLGYTKECDTKAPGFMELSRMRETDHKLACNLLSGGGKFHQEESRGAWREQGVLVLAVLDLNE